MRDQVVAHFFDIRITDYFDSPFLQFARIRGDVCQVIRDKSDVMAKRVKELENLEHPERSRIAIRHWKIMVNYQNVFSRKRPRLREELYIAVGWFRHQFSGPSFRKCRTINLLMLLCTG